MSNEINDTYLFDIRYKKQSIFLKIIKNHLNILMILLIIFFSINHLAIKDYLFKV
jgi:hypothetical protein